MFNALSHFLFRLFSEDKRNLLFIFQYCIHWSSASFCSNMPDDSKEMSIASALTNIDPCWASQLKAQREHQLCKFYQKSWHCRRSNIHSWPSLIENKECTWHHQLPHHQRSKIHSCSSDEERRMAYLKGRGTSNESSPSVVCKKRITFELHPDVIIEDLLSDMGYEWFCRIFLI